MPEPQAITLLRPFWHYGTTPVGLALLLGAGPHLKDMDKSFDERNERYRKMGIEAPLMEPGDLPMADAKPFIEKRAALQQTKTAALPAWVGSPTILGGSILGAGAIGNALAGSGSPGPLSEAGSRRLRDMCPTAIG